MTAFLSFAIYAPLSSWGEIAVGEVRDSLDRPTRSAVLGLVGAALGVDRDDSEALSALESNYGVAVHSLTTGSALRDYHTVQSVQE
jgi:CRISPR system Cascade subunit CasD